MSTRALTLLVVFCYSNLSTSLLTAQTGNRNLIPALDLKTATVSGTWTKTEGELNTTEKNARLMLPGILSGSYALTVEFTRNSKQDSIGVILPVGMRQCLFNLSAFKGEAHGIGLIDGKLARDNLTTVKPGTLKNNHPYRLLIEVDLKNNVASISSQLDGRPFLKWSGNPKSLSMFPAWKLPKTDQAGLYTNCDVTFHSITINRLDPKMRMIKPVASPSKNKLSAPSKGPVLYYDLTHGEKPAGILEKLGQNQNFSIQSSTKPITADSLQNIRLLYLRGPAKSFTPAEKKTIIDFVRNGGALMLMMDEERRMPLKKTGVNDLLTPFGMELTDDTDYLHNCGAIAKAGKINKADRELPFSGGRAVKGGTPFGFQLDQEGNPAQTFAAYQQIDGGGKIVVLAEGMASAFMGTKEGIRLSGVPRNPAKTTYWGKDSEIFMSEVIAWLMAGKK
ncbi:hypothetical protein [uncultured Gimesia sp.]|uniref:hypothetical protein n=1 Tax=uncultured Gimesia sp. TaxID=1678688 RepID=UPI00260AF06F|nr:hypothetical protein [uncultured Gimesia sp.]